MKYSVEDLIYHVCENNNFRNSGMNHQKLQNCGIESGKAIDLGNNCSVVFVASHGGIRKDFYWGQRLVTRDTVARRVLGGENQDE